MKISKIKMKRLEEEQLRQELIEGYQARRVEDAGINSEWERATLEHWDESDSDTR